MGYPPYNGEGLNLSTTEIDGLGFNDLLKNNEATRADRIKKNAPNVQGKFYGLLTFHPLIAYVPRPTKCQQTLG